MELISKWGKWIFKIKQIKGHEGAQQVVRDPGWHCPAEPRIEPNREVLGEAVVSLEAGEGLCAILWVSWAAVSCADRLEGWPGAGGWQRSVEGSVAWGPLPMLASVVCLT